MTAYCIFEAASFHPQDYTSSSYCKTSAYPFCAASPPCRYASALPPLFDDTLYHILQAVSQTMFADYENGGTKNIITPPKSVRSVREIPLPGFLIQKLRKYKLEQGRGCSYILNTSGKPMEPCTYQYQFQKLLKIANVEKANFHTLRHTFSTRALELGFDVKTLSEILGHASASITLKKYAHSLDEHKRQSMEMLGQLCV